jgi:hypothetical protein
VCFAIASGLLVTPVDLVKPKSTVRLQRLRNLEHDPRAALVCEHWDPDDWSRLWWVRAGLRRSEPDPSWADRRREGEAALREKYDQYRGVEFAEIVSFAVVDVSGWSA